MTRSSFLILICGAVAAGCASPREYVYVDVEHVLLAEEAPRTTKAEQLPLRMEAIHAETAIPAIGSRSIADPNAAKRLAAARRELDEQRSAALKNMMAQLIKSFGRDIDRFRLEQSAEIDKQMKLEMEASSDDVAALLQTYADKRWPITNRLALLVGYPHPPFTKIRKPEADDRIGTKRYGEIRDLYIRLAAVEAEFQRDVQAIFARFYESASQKQLELGLKVVEKIDEAERRARTEAEKTVAAVNSALDLSLTELAAINLPSVPGAQSSVHAAPKTFDPIPSKTGPDDSIMTRRDAIANDLRIWLGSHALRQSQSPLGVRDATENFIHWRQSMRNER